MNIITLLTLLQYKKRLFPVTFFQFFKKDTKVQEQLHESRK